jgi:hypothetical protein
MIQMFAPQDCLAKALLITCVTVVFSIVAQWTTIDLYPSNAGEKAMSESIDLSRFK